jgi:Flp pilus assembly protein TadG
MTADGMASRSAIALFQRNRDGATAIEFGILAIPFCLLLFAILESCISFAAQQVMSNVTDDIARQIRTGRLPAADNNKTAMTTKICGELAIIVSSCSTNLVIDLRVFDTYALAAAAAPIKLKGTGSSQDIDETDFAVKAGGARTRKHAACLFTAGRVMTDLLRLSMSNIREKQTLLFATTTWRNEPF